MIGIILFERTSAVNGYSERETNMATDWREENGYPAGALPKRREYHSAKKKKKKGVVSKQQEPAGTVSMQKYDKTDVAAMAAEVSSDTAASAASLSAMRDHALNQPGRASRVQKSAAEKPEAPRAEEKLPRVSELLGPMTEGTHDVSKQGDSAEKQGLENRAENNAPVAEEKAEVERKTAEESRTKPEDASIQPETARERDVKEAQPVPEKPKVEEKQEPPKEAAVMEKAVPDVEEMQPVEGEREETPEVKPEVVPKAAETKPVERPKKEAGPEAAAGESAEAKLSRLEERLADQVKTNRRLVRGANVRTGILIGLAALFVAGFLYFQTLFTSLANEFSGLVQSTTQLAETAQDELTGVMEKLDSVDFEALNRGVEGISAIDFEALNDSIRSLNDSIDPFAEFMGMLAGGAVGGGDDAAASAAGEE